ncbi:MAG: heme exporter protein CcmB [Lysobacterales bacterium]
MARVSVTPLGAAAALLSRDLQMALRRPDDALQPLLFAVIVAALFPFALGADAARLAPIAGGVTWVVALLALLIGLDSVYRGDEEDGSLDQLLVSGQPLALLCAARMLAHWLVVGLPLVLVTPLLGRMLGMPARTLMVALVSLALGTGVLVAIGHVCAALAVAAKRSVILVPLLVLPLAVPVLIFGAGAVQADLIGLSPAAPLLLLAAGLALAIPLAPLATAAALRLNAG